MKNLLKLLILNLIFISCKDESKVRLTELKNQDVEKTTELITQIFEDEKKGFLFTNCITEKARGVNRPMVSDFDEYVKNHLKIKDSIHYNLQLESYKKFILTSDITKGKNILTQSQFKEFERKSELGEFKFWDWLENNCSDGYSSISKPIFNENYTLAYIQIGTVCGSLCGGGEERIYEYINGTWIEKENFGNWVS
ncbi:hypothetical protein [Aquimarina sp. BL5]|uniref:hypothetical protein n=1 Tax=Aquimarina sp. BL5 TaxID=1714860 RepID=UPI001F3EC09B|nr:hypothetical protein [Aquimarina sp. BL5]